MQKIFTKRMQNTVKKYREQRFLEEKYL
jgi:hypothetical protein